jgi:hypothetical protein
MPDIVLPLTIRDLAPGDLLACRWAGTATHQAAIAHGYHPYSREPDSWDQEAPDGTITRYETMLTLMRKDLP